MKKIKEHIKTYLYDLPPKKRTDEMTLEFIKWLMQHRGDEYLEIADEVGTSSLVAAIARDSNEHINIESQVVRRALIIAFDEFIDSQIEDIDYEIEELEEFGDPNSSDYEYRKNGFAGESDFWKWKEG